MVDESLYQVPGQQQEAPQRNLGRDDRPLPGAKRQGGGAQQKMQGARGSQKRGG